MNSHAILGNDYTQIHVITYTHSSHYVVCMHDDDPPCHIQVHVNILVLEARLQAELIYALRAIMMHMK